MQLKLFAIFLTFGLIFGKTFCDQKIKAENFFPGVFLKLMKNEKKLNEIEPKEIFAKRMAWENEIIKRMAWGNSPMFAIDEDYAEKKDFLEKKRINWGNDENSE